MAWGEARDAEAGEGLMEPYISFIAVGRNDGYGGDFLGRTNAFLECLLSFVEGLGVVSELILVEWAPPADRSRLKDALTWPRVTRKHCAIRIIEVPPSVHAIIPNPGKLPLLEYIGKNVGARRARGEYFLTTNPDVLFNRSLIEFLTAKRLSPSCYYRIDRCDLRAPVPAAASAEDLMAFCRRNVIQIHGLYYTYPNTWRDRLKLALDFRTRRHLRRKDAPLPVPHVNASGDFFLAHRDAWCRIRGFAEFERQGGPHHIDLLMVLSVLYGGWQQVILEPPLRLYHQDHARPEVAKPWSGAVETAFKQLRKTRQAMVFNDERWGLGDQSLPETSL